jgi:hypothetical protein
MLRSWGLGRLVTSWVVYWVILLAVVLGPTARQYWELQRSDAAHGTVSFSWSGSSLQLVLLFVGPPLLMTLLWIMVRPRRP